MLVRAFRSRRVTAVVQLLLFAMSTSTMLLPCAHDSDATPAPAASVASHASERTHAMHGGVEVQTTTSDGRHETPSHHGSAPAHTACPWVVGCAGMVRVDLDAPWRAAENAMPNATPVGVTLRRVIVDRDVESPPPRA